MKKLKYLLSLSFAILLLFGCEDLVEAPDTNYIGFAKATHSTGVNPGSTATYDITVFTANKKDSDRSFEVAVNSTGAAAGSFTVPSSVTIPAGTNEGTLTVSLSDTNLGIGVNSLIISIVPQEGLSIKGTTRLNYIQNCNEVTATLAFAFDGYGSEVGWRITDALGGVVASKAAGSYADGQATATESITLCQGRNYTLTVTDSFGDGLSFPTNGYFTLTINGVVKATGGGDYGASISRAFNTN